MIMTSLGVSSSVCFPPGSAPVPITDGQPQPWVIMPAQSSRIIIRYRHRLSIWFGAILIVLGCLSIIWNLVLIGHVGFLIASIVWCGPCGVMFIVTGSFGISAGRRKTKCPIVTFMVLCIIASVMCIVQFLFGVFNTIHCVNRANYYPCIEVETAMSILAGITAALAALIAICGSSLCCRAMDCCNPAAAQPYGIPMMVISQPSGQAAPMTVLAPTNTAGVYSYQMIPAQPTVPIQPLPAAMTAQAESYAPPDYSDLACADSPSEPLIPPAYGYAADHVDEKKMPQN